MFPKQIIYLVKVNETLAYQNLNNSAEPDEIPAFTLQLTPDLVVNDEHKFLGNIIHTGQKVTDL